MKCNKECEMGYKKNRFDCSLCECYDPCKVSGSNGWLTSIVCTHCNMRRYNSIYICDINIHLVIYILVN